MNTESIFFSSAITKIKLKLLLSNILSLNSSTFLAVIKFIKVSRVLSLSLKPVQAKETRKSSGTIDCMSYSSCGMITRFSVRLTEKLTVGLFFTFISFSCFENFLYPNGERYSSLFCGFTFSKYRS